MPTFRMVLERECPVRMWGSVEADSSAQAQAHLDRLVDQCLDDPEAAPALFHGEWGLVEDCEPSVQEDDGDYVGLINAMLTRAATWCAGYTLMRWHMGYDRDDLYLEVNRDGSIYDLLVVSHDAAPVPHCLTIELSELWAEDHLLHVLDIPSEQMLPPGDEACPPGLAQVQAVFEQHAGVFEQHAGLVSRLSAMVYQRCMDAADPDGLFGDVEVAISHTDLTAVIQQWHAARRQLELV